MLRTAEVIKVNNLETPEKTTKVIWEELRSDFAEWMTANRDLVWRPTIELTKGDNEFVAKALLSGVDPKDVEVLVAPERLLIKGEVRGGKSDRRKLLCSIRFPRLVNSDRVRAEINDGVLSVRARIADASKANIRLLRAA